MSDLLEDLRARLAAVADPVRAAGQQAYMKSAMPYHGVSAVPLRRLCKDVFKDLSWPDGKSWQADVLALWRGATHREERYAAIELSGVRAARAFQHVDALTMYEEMIVTGAWWDFVDTIAGHRLWTLLENDRERMRTTMLAWSTDRDMWKRRSSILCQLRAKTKTDLDLLYACIEPSLDSKQFFLRKAIGWALRQYAWTDPVEIRRYVAAHEARLSGLSRREALKNIGKAIA
ncbi:MAG TPA: DNA alkylation repair protein [Allosphingosinicella sp.]|nr:DNA alkylation repair protein [Allosphingosinicella sp.]